MYKKDSITCNSRASYNEKSVNTTSREDLKERILTESNLCHEVGMTVLNILSLFIGHHKVYNRNKTHDSLSYNFLF